MSDDYEVGIVLMCEDCGVPVEVVVLADLAVAYQCPECDAEVDLPNPDTLGFH